MEESSGLMINPAVMAAVASKAAMVSSPILPAFVHRRSVSTVHASTFRESLRRSLTSILFRHSLVLFSFFHLFSPASLFFPHYLCLGAHAQVRYTVVCLCVCVCVD